MITNIQELLLAKADQINNKSNKNVYGKAAEYERQLAICQFKACIWFTHNKAGQAYSAYDYQQNKNIGRRYIPSFDTVGYGAAQVIDHEIALSVLIDYLFQNIATMNKALVFIVDRIKGEEIMILNFNPANVAMSRYVHPEFKKDLYGNNFYDYVINPLRVDKLRVIQ
ncbi:MAG: hypothetical protein ACXVDV_20020 [Bacteroidia bacterium]